MSDQAAPSGQNVQRPFLSVTWQHGLPAEVGINGCRVDDVLHLVSEKLRAFQSGPLACEENANALLALDSALASLASRRQRRMAQGVFNTMQAHESERTEDVDSDFSATGA